LRERETSQKGETKLVGSAEEVKIINRVGSPELE